MNDSGSTGSSKPLADKEGVFLVPECDSQHQLASFVEALENSIKRKPKKITLKFLGMQRLNPDAALVIYDTLRLKDVATELVTDAKSPLMDSTVMIWLAGERRFIRSTAWIKFAGPSSPRKQPAFRFPWDDAEWWKQNGEDEEIPRFLNPNYQTVLKLINKHLPVNLLADRLLLPHVLDEYCLLSHQT